MKFFLIIALCAMAYLALANETVPKDVQKFIRDAEACEHFAGEFDDSLSTARKREIERSVVTYCKRAQHQLKNLSARYARNARVTEIIRNHTNESVASFR
jgi:hypothetical protein